MVYGYYTAPHWPATPAKSLILRRSCSTYYLPNTKNNNKTKTVQRKRGGRPKVGASRRLSASAPVRARPRTARVAQLAAVRPKHKRRSLYSVARDATSGIGGLLGGPAASAAISGAASLFEKITGMGEYTVKRNTLMTQNGPPLFENSSHSTEIIHREFVQNVYTTTSFNVESFDINPGNRGLFPWAAPFACNFESYEITGMVVEFKSTSADAVGSPDTALGTVIMTTVYDVNKPNFQDKKSMEAYEFTVSGPPSLSFIHPVECDPSQLVLPQLYVTDTATVAPSALNPLLAEGTVDDAVDRRFHDMGRFEIATEGMQVAGKVCGELWVSYRMKLFKPRIAPNTSGHAKYGGVINVPANPFGTTAPYQYKNNDPSMTIFVAKVSGVTSNFIKFRDPGLYEVDYSCLTLSGFTAGSTSLTLHSGAFVQGSAGCWYSTTDPEYHVYVANRLMSTHIVRIQTAGTVLKFALLGGGTDNGVFDCNLRRLPESISPAFSLAAIEVKAPEKMYPDSVEAHMRKHDKHHDRKSAPAAGDSSSRAVSPARSVRDGVYIDRDDVERRR